MFYFYHLSLASPDVRVRVREGVVRVRITETGIRPVIRIPTPQQELIPFYLPSTPVGSRSVIRCRRGERVLFQKTIFKELFLERGASLICEREAQRFR